MNPLTTVDNLLNSLTQYRLVFYLLLALATLAIILGLTGALPFGGLSLGLSVGALVTFCYLINLILGKLWKAPTNFESPLITALILFFILTPVSDMQGVWQLFLASLFAMASKFVLAWRHKHLFNPAALAAVVLLVLNLASASWWVGHLNLALPVAVVGLLIVRKIRRFSMLGAFILATLTVAIGYGFFNGVSPADLLYSLFLAGPLLFFATVMFTEPQTTPPTRKLQLVYGSIVGGLAAWPTAIGPYYLTPEIALVIGNLFSYLVSPKGKYVLELKDKKQLAPAIYEFSFSPDSKPAFKAGEYLEWTLSDYKPDARGNRRYFTIASSPTEAEVKLAIRLAQPGSSFKRQLMQLESGQRISAGALAGDFTLPEDKSKKLVFIAGGIGNTPFRCMLKYLTDKREKRDIILFFANKEVGDFVFRDVFHEAEEKLGLKMVEVLTTKEAPPSGWSGKVGFIDENLLKEEVPDYVDRLFYLSGPPGMVNSYKKLLHHVGISRQKIITDYFPGY